MKFERTTCACADCVAECKKQSGSLIPGDMEKISAFLGEPVEPYLVASRGSLVMDMRTWQTKWIGSITPKMENGRCVFLDENDRCKIHPVSPAGCALFDTHMGMVDGQKRAVWLAMQMDTEDYQLARAAMPSNQNPRYHPKDRP
jgi:Fe-S-cluster containining protein